MVVAPSLPPDFRRFLESLPAQRGLASSSTEAYAGKPVVMDTSGVDSLSEGCREFAVRHGIQDGWRAPLFSGTRELIGTLTAYWREAQTLDPQRMAKFESAAQLAAVAIEHRQLYNRLAFQAQHDVLTELPNRLLLHDRLQNALLQAKRHRNKVAVIWVDLDRFKQINDTLGHRTGDMVLRTVAQRLTQCVRATDTVARVGGDEFVLVVAELTDEQGALRVAQKLLDAFQPSFLDLQPELHITASIGVSFYPDHGTDAGVLVRNADEAMYVAKQAGKNTYCFFAPELRQKAMRKLEIEKYLRSAMQESQLGVHYQPLMDLNRNLRAVEALARWNSPELGPVSPDEFIPIAEESGLILQIGSWVLKQACCQGVEWQRRGFSPVRIAVNVSAVQFVRPDFTAMLSDILSETGMNPELLELELTETALMTNLQDASRKVDSIREMGISVSIDDFGAGYSSMNYVHQLAVDCIKIDRSFIRDLGFGGRNTQSVVEAIISMAHGMKLRVVAEGVETEQQFSALDRLGCDLIQGYLLKRPGSAESIEQMMSQPALSSA